MLPGDPMKAVLRGSFGFLWLATQRGLIRYDGTQIRWYRHDPDNTATLSSSDITVLIEDKRHQLWVGTSNGLNLLDRYSGAVYRIPIDSGHNQTNSQALPIWAIAEDDHHGLWVGTEKGLYHMEKGGRLKPYHQAAIAKVSALVRDKAGRLLIGTDGSGLYRLETFGQALKKQTDFEPQKIMKLSVDLKNVVWVGTTKGLFYQTSHQTPFLKKILPGQTQSSEEDFWITGIVQDASKRLWVGTRNGLYALAEDKITRFQYEPGDTKSLSDNRIISLCSDSENILWVATLAHSLDVLNLNREKMNFHNLENKEVQHIVTVSPTQILVATKRGGLALFNPQRKEIESWFLPKQTVRHISHSGGNQYLIGCDSGLFSLNLSTHQTTQLWQNGRVWRSLKTSAGRTFFGTDVGLFEWQPNGEPKLLLGSGDDAPQKIARPIITSLAYEGEKYLYVGTFGGGVYRYDLKNGDLLLFSRESASHPLTSNDVIDLFLDNQANLWIATLSGGLHRWHQDEQKMETFNNKTGFPDNAVVSIEQDKTGTLWVNTGVGIVKLGPGSNQTLVYNERDGNLGGSAVPGSGTFDSQTNTMYFGGSEGMVWFNPEQLPMPYSPNIVFTSFKNKWGEQRHLLDPKTTLVLKPDEEPFSVEYAVLDYLKNRPYQYGFKRTALDSGWIQSRIQTPINFTGNLLFGGTDQLQIQAISEASKTLQSQLNLKILPPFWVRWLPLGIVLIIALIATILYLLISRLERRKRQKLQEKAQMAEARTAIAEQQARLALQKEQIERDMRVRQENHALVLQEHLDEVSTEIANSLHDGPLSLLQGLRFQLAEVESSNPESSEILHKATNTWVPEITLKLRHLCGRMLKPQLTHGLIVELESIVQSLQTVHPNWLINAHFEPGIEELSRSQKIKLVRIFRTLVHNISKHAQATEVTSSLAIKGTYALLTVEDNGKGFNVPTNLKLFRENKHYGLYMADYFATSLQGRFQIQSAPGKGTVATISVPLHSPETTEQD